MDMTNIPLLFGVNGKTEISPVTSGHINATYLVSAEDGEYILQSLNRAVFRSPETVMANIAAVESAFSRSGAEDVCLPEFLSSEGRNYAEYDGGFWRMYRYARSGGEVRNKEELAGYAFGTFIKALSGSKVKLAPAIEGYHDFNGYFSMLTSLAGSDGMKSIDSSVLGRLGSLSETLSGVFTADIPKRIIHGDAKTDNVIIGEKCTVIDLDTAMSGYAALDYGDMVRSVCGIGYADLDRISSVTDGFARGLGGLLSGDETDTLYYGVLWATGELAARYLADHIAEERYFVNRSRAECLGRAHELLRQLNMFINSGDEIMEMIHSSFGKYCSAGQ